MLAGDFNAILNENEKQGGFSQISGACHLFNNFVNDYCLKDIDFQGLKFTWNRGAIFERLDPALCNQQWEGLAPNTLVAQLHKIKSDHRPIAINFRKGLVRKVPRPFRFLSRWLSHEGFNQLVVDNWILGDGLEGIVSNFIDVVKN